MHKTGTTSLQAALAANRELLLAHGIVCPSVRAVPVRAIRSAEDATWQATVRGLVEDAARLRAHTVLISHETLSTFSAEHLRAVAACLDGHDIRYVACFRHWSGFLPSRWTQNCMRRDAQTFEEYLAMVCDPVAPHIDHRFDLVLARATDAFGASAVAAVSYDAAVERDGSALRDLLRALGLPDGIVSALARAERVNARRDWRLTELTRLFNGLIAERLGLPQNGLCRAVRDAVPCDEFFDLRPLIERLDAASSARLLELLDVERYELTRDVPSVDTAARGLDAYAALFTNAGGPVFRTHQPIRLTTTNLTWAEFRNADPALVDRAAAQLEGALASRRGHRGGGTR